MDMYSVKDKTLSVRLRCTQMTAETISKIFNVFPQSIVLVGDYGTVATLDENGDFSLYEMSTDVVWSVNGNSSKPTKNQNVTSRPSTSYTYQQPTCTSETEKKSKWKPSGTHHKPPGVTKQESKRLASANSWTKTVEICRFDSNDMGIKKTFNFPVTQNEIHQ